VPEQSTPELKLEDEFASLTRPVGWKPSLSMTRNEGRLSGAIPEMNLRMPSSRLTMARASHGAQEGSAASCARRKQSNSVAPSSGNPSGTATPASARTRSPSPASTASITSADINMTSSRGLRIR
jgi:hypothetical protein